MAKKSFAVIGLGQFGISIVEELVDNGMDVIAIDNDEETAKEDACLIEHAISDTTFEKIKSHLRMLDKDI